MQIADLDYKEAAAELARRVSVLGFTMTTAFVPFSKSRNAGAKSPSLNWRCTIPLGLSGALVCDYMQGAGYAPAAKAGKRWENKTQQEKAIAIECESGRRAYHHHALGTVYAGASDIPAPPIADVIASLARDSDALDYANFEQWAGEFGYDPDSRSAEATYRLCLSHALALRAAIGDEQLSELRQLAAMM